MGIITSFKDVRNNIMKIYLMGSLLTLLVLIIIATWIKYALPNWGAPLGFGMGIAFLIGFFTGRLY